MQMRLESSAPVSCQRKCTPAVSSKRSLARARKAAVLVPELLVQVLALLLELLVKLLGLLQSLLVLLLKSLLKLLLLLLSLLALLLKLLMKLLMPLLQLLLPLLALLVQLLRQPLWPWSTASMAATSMPRSATAPLPPRLAHRVAACPACLAPRLSTLTLRCFAHSLAVSAELAPDSLLLALEAVPLGQ